MDFSKYGTTPIQIADKYLGNYKVKDNEINAEICPFCESQTDKWKFYLNIDEGTYYCHRQNNCGVSGSFRQLLQHFGEHEGQKYDPPDVKNSDVSDKILKYFKKRGIDKEIIQSHNISTSDKGQIAFEYYEDGELVLVKYRNFGKGKDKRYWQEGGGKPVLWELDYCDTDLPLKITEGEIDKLALHQAGIQNVVSIPFGSNNFEWVENNWEKLDEFEEIIICPDNDDAGEKFADECIKRLGEWRCKIAKPTWPDINHELFKEGEEGLKELINNASYKEDDSWLQLHEIDEIDPAKIPTTKSSIPKLNKFLRGYREGELTIWTGINGSGKSTLLLQEAIYAASEGTKVAVITGENKPGKTRYIFSLQLAGPDNIDAKMDTIRDELTYYVPGEKYKKLLDWARGKLFVYKNERGLEVDKIKRKAEEAVKRYGCKMIIIDNLMKVNYQCSYQEKYNQQAQFVNDMKDFAMKYDCHVHIVAHPRKPKDTIVTKEDVAGLYEITNLADNVMCVHRVNKETVMQALGIKELDVKGAVEIFKNRTLGIQDKIIRMNFDKSCETFWQYGAERQTNFNWS